MKRTVLMAAVAVAFMFLGRNFANGQSLGTAFTYQGQLKDAGVAADGLYDLRFKIFNAATGGTQIGGTIQLANYQVTDGLFTVELDFGAAVYNNNSNPEERWLEITVELDTLSPRQPFTGVPYSIQTRGLDVVDNGAGLKVGVGRAGMEKFNVYASTTSFGGMRVQTEATGNPFYGYHTGDINDVRHFVDGDSGEWVLHNGEDRIVVDPNGFVGINRDYRIATHETFGIYQNTNTDTVAERFGGVFVDTNTDGRPYFGYAVDGDNIGYTYMDGANNKWHLVNNGIRLTVLDNGFVGIGETQPLFNLEVNGSAGKTGGGSWSMASDRRLKKNINDLEGSLEKLMKVRGVTFEYLDPKSINELEGERIGVIAQELEKVFPDWVDERGDGYKAVTFRGFEALAIEAIRELRDEKNKQIEMLEKANTEVQDENDELRDRLELLELHVQQLVESMQPQLR